MARGRVSVGNALSLEQNRDALLTLRAQPSAHRLDRSNG